MRVYYGPSIARYSVTFLVQTDSIDGLVIASCLAVLYCFSHKAFMESVFTNFISHLRGENEKHSILIGPVVK